MTACGIPIPRLLKKSLTIIQIIQLVFSDLLAALYIFISYDIPVEIRDTVAPKTSSPFNVQAGFASPRYSQPSLQYRKQRVSCIDTSGQAFAAWLSVLYLSPLIWLFIRFFIQSYSNQIPGRIKTQDRKYGNDKEGNRQDIL